LKSAAPRGGTRGWSALRLSCYLKLRAIENERHFRAIVEFVDKLLDRIGDQENHPSMGLLDIVTTFMHDSEDAMSKFLKLVLQRLYDF
jgi:hypothetical protein